MSEPVPEQPAWLPDPTGRHQHRWWDGHRFTDRVADDGQASVDAGPAAPPGPSSPAVVPPEPLVRPPWTPAPATPAGPAWWPAPGPDPLGARPAKRSRVPLLLAVAGVLLVAGGAAALLVARGDGDGSGTFTGAIDGDLATHEVSLEAGDVLLVTLAPGGDLDAVLGLLVDEPAAEALEETYEDLPLVERGPPAAGLSVGTDDLGEGLELVMREDLRFAGEPEQLLLAVADPLEATVVVAPFDPESDADDYEITIEVVALEVEEGADGETLLEAVEEAEDVPADLREVAEEILAGS